MRFQFCVQYGASFATSPRNVVRAEEIAEFIVDTRLWKTNSPSQRRAANNGYYSRGQNDFPKGVRHPSCAITKR